MRPVGALDVKRVAHRSDEIEPFTRWVDSCNMARDLQLVLGKGFIAVVVGAYLQCDIAVLFPAPPTQLSRE